MPDAEPLPADFTEPRDDDEEVKKPKKGKKKQQAPQDDGLGDLLQASGTTPTHAESKAANEVDDLMDLLGGGGPAPAAAPAAAKAAGGKVTMWLQPEAATGGLKLGGSFRRSGGQMFMDFQAQNCGQQQLGGFAIQVNKNSFQLQPDNPQLQMGPLGPGQMGSCTLTLNTGGQMALQKPLMNLQIAIKNNAGVSYFQCQPPLHMVYSEDGALSRDEFLGMWKSLPQESESKTTVEGIAANNPDELTALLKTSNLFLVAQMKGKENQVVMYFSAKLVNNIVVLVEVAIWPGRKADVALKAKNAALPEPFHASMKQLLLGQ